ncbi:MAG TPA: ribose-5-phosphate isomerase RpiA [Hyphomicrobiaceae bacterium]|nr:ribose-5-phosphate isomerase RpiA [Hyphomicrobiaceae bacterium]
MTEQPAAPDAATVESWKIAAAKRALEHVRFGMKLGLGTGSTAAHFVRLLGERALKGLDVTCVPTSEATRRQAESLGLKVATLDEEPLLDLTIDGADEVDGELRLLKGGGGALLREKIVATASERMIVIADGTKAVRRLGAFPLPIEIVRFGEKATIGMIDMLSRDAGCSGELKVRTRADGERFITDGGNVIVDCRFGAIPDPELLDEALKLIPGVVEHGLFLGLADVAIIADHSGVRMLKAAYDIPEVDAGN